MITTSHPFKCFLMLCVFPFIDLSGVLAADTDTQRLLYGYQGIVLRDSEWGKLSEFQAVLSDALVACGGQAYKVDGVYGNDTHDALIQLLACPAYREILPDGESAFVSVALWRKLLPASPLPSTHDRAFAVALSHEATDYDRMEWNYETADDKSALTWGPFGATVGWGNEVREILKRIHHADPVLLRDTFGDDYTTIEQLMQAPRDQGYSLMKPCYFDPECNRRVKQAFQKLGREHVARTEYDELAFETNDWLAPNFRRLYSLIPEPESSATEIDYAFFLDLGMHASVSESRIRKARAALSEMENRLGRTLSPAQRRRVIGEVFVAEINSRWAADRLGRNVVFFVDAIGTSNLTEDELQAWRQRTGRFASMYGLSDSRRYFPDFLH